MPFNWHTSGQDNLRKKPSLAEVLVQVRAQADQRHVENLPAPLLLFISKSHSVITNWEKNAPRNSDSTELVGVSRAVDAVFLKDLPDVIEKSVKSAECGSREGGEVIRLCDSLKEGATRKRFDKLIDRTRTLATESGERANFTKNQCRNIRHGICDIMEDIYAKLGKKRDLLRGLKMADLPEFSKMRKALREIMINLEQQEETVGVLVDWWMEIENQLGLLYDYLDNLHLGDKIRLNEMRDRLIVLVSSYESYISVMSQFNLVGDTGGDTV